MKILNNLEYSIYRNENVKNWLIIWHTCVEDTKVIGVNFARNISRKRWGERNKTPHLQREKKKKTNKQTKETSSSLIDFHNSY